MAKHRLWHRHWQNKDIGVDAKTPEELATALEEAADKLRQIAALGAVIKGSGKDSSRYLVVSDPNPEARNRVNEMGFLSTNLKYWDD